MSGPPDRLPAALASLKSWVVWRLIQKEGKPGKPSKVPFYTNGKPRGNAHGTPEDRALLVSFDEAVRVARMRGYSGVGLAMLPENGIVALDFDHVVSEGVIDARVQDLVSGTYAEISPSGTGVRAFMLGALDDRKDITPKAGNFAVEFFHSKGFVTVTGNTLPGASASAAAPLSDAVKALHAERFGSGISTALTTTDDGNWLITQSPKVGLSIDAARALLAKLDPEMGYSDWLGVGQALHHEFDGDADGLALFDEWSSAASNYDGTDAIEKKWASFGRHTGAPRTMAWVLKIAKPIEQEASYAARLTWIEKVKSNTVELDLREHVCSQIAKDDRLNDFDREQVAQAVVETLKGLGTRVTIAQARKMVGPKTVPEVSTNMPPWLVDWVYVTNSDTFFNLETGTRLTITGFNQSFDRECIDAGLANSDERGVAVPIAMNRFRLTTVDGTLYVPFADRVFEHNGKTFANAFLHSSVPQAAEHITAEGRFAVEFVRRHISLLCDGREEETNTLVYWLAHNVQFPGRKIRWAPLIVGIEGDGKSAIGKLLEGVLGPSNIKDISPRVLGTDFNSYAEGGCIGKLEELKLTGHNRHDVMNALKPLITNDSVQIHRKGENPFDGLNTMNYIAFTNYTDALPITDTDRRWMILQTPWNDFAGLEKLLKKTAGVRAATEYFDKLFVCILSQRAALRRWLLDVEIPEDFKPQGRAPATRDKLRMIALSTSDEETAAKEIIEEGRPGVGLTVLASSYLVQEMLASEAGFRVATQSISKILTRLGWSRLPGRLKWQGNAETVWVKGSVEVRNSDVRAALDASLTQPRREPVDDMSDLFGD